MVAISVPTAGRCLAYPGLGSEAAPVTRPRLVQTEFVASAATYSVVTALSHAGLVRDHNEDSLVIGQ